MDAWDNAGPLARTGRRHDDSPRSAPLHAMPSTSTRDTLLRQWHLLSLVPQSPRSASIATLHEGLADAGFPVTRRTVERDLHKLADVGFPLWCDEASAHHRWALIASGRSWIPAVPSVNEALLLVLTQQYLKPLLPPPLLRALAPTFKSAEAVLTASAPKQRLARWQQKVRAALPAQPLLAPAIAPDVQAACSDALFEDVQLAITYDSRSRSKRQALVLNPLGLIQRGLVSYLVATSPPHTDPRLYALHRIRTARVLPSAVPSGVRFSLTDFLEQGFGDFGKGRRIQVRLVVSPSVAAHLAECRISRDQTIAPVRAPSGWSRVTATTNDTPQLRWWLRGFGDEIRVERPAT